MIDAAIVHLWWPWYSSSPTQPEENRDALIALAGIAAVVWTGGLVAYTIYREYSPTLSVGIGIVQVSYIAPIIGLICHGATLRTIAFIAGWGYGIWAGIGLLLFFLTPRGIAINATPSDDTKKNDPEAIAIAQHIGKQIEAFVTRMRTATPFYFMVTFCACSVFYFATATSVAWASLTLLIFALAFTYSALFYNE